MTKRRSKVRSKTRSDSSQKSEDEIVYCICRSSDGTRFMIACDNCEEWYHGDCINVTPKQANNIKRFFCHLCIGRNPSLEIEYKTSKENRARLPNLRQQIKKINFSSDDDENDADLSSSSSPDKSLASTKSKRALRKRWRPSISESVVKKRRGRPKERHDEYDEEATEDEVETSGFVPGMGDGLDDEDVYRGSGQVARAMPGRGQMNRTHVTAKSAVNRSFVTSNYGREDPKCGCGVCEACKMSMDCGQCDICLRYSSSSNPRAVCRKRRCLGNSSDYRPQVRRSYHLTKDYGDTIIDDDFETVVDDGQYHRQNLRRRGDTVVGGDVRQRLSNAVCVGSNNKEPCVIGSKMRRGDHLPGGGGGGGGQGGSCHRRGLTGGASVPYKCYGEQSQDQSGHLGVGAPSYRYNHHSNYNNNRLSRNQPSRDSGTLRRVRHQSDTAQMSSNTSSVSGHMSSHQYHQYVPDDSADDDDEDVMIPSELISPSNNGTRQPIDASDHRPFLNNQQHRITKNIVISDNKQHHYGLNYPDHLYCKHHRSYNWHGSLLVDDLSSELVTPRPESSSSLSMFKTSTTSAVASATQVSSLSPHKDHIVHTQLRSPPLEPPLSPSNYLVHDSSNNNNRSSGSSSAGAGNGSNGSNGGASKIGRQASSVMATIVAGLGTLPDQRHGKTPHGKSAGVSLVVSSSSGSGGDRQSYQMVDLNEPMMMIAATTTSSSSTDKILHRASSSQSTNKDSNPSPSTDNNSNDNNKKESSLAHATSVFMKSSLVGVAHTHTQEFYTINDEDDLEINWPKETVNV